MLQTKQLAFRYNNLSETLKFPDFSLDTGNHLIITGKSGSGKTTLLHLLGSLIKPLSGDIEIEKTSMSKLSDRKSDSFRNEKIGFIFQDNHLIDSLTVFQNIAVAQIQKDTAKIVSLLDRLGISHKKEQYPQNLSRGEKQRVAIARGIINNPSIVLADEPTSSLDDENTLQVINLLKNLASTTNSSLIIVTHDQRIVNHFENIIKL